ncbi:piggyBac transposable element-derived protein 4-like [Bradysia coprophila]|uniref:piggyBac transposable element-derived protein 4-like n=1 Tax=Bradysia coprophila TaxID=38358 RepID=UPI00187D6F0F|nr:piggyBac transposable element-derived protein 4-like [Bradysia coprophila]
MPRNRISLLSNVECKSTTKSLIYTSTRRLQVDRNKLLKTSFLLVVKTKLTMSRNKRRYDSESEESDADECFFADSDNSLFADADQDPLKTNEQLDSSLDDDEDPLGSGMENCTLDFDFDDIAGENDEEESFASDSDFDDDSECESTSGADTEAENDNPLPKEKLQPVKWTNVPSNFVPRKEIPTYKEPDMRAEEDSTPVDLFFELFPRRLFEWIAKCTNERLDIYAAKKGIDAEHTDCDEMILVIGCLLVMGYNRLPHMQMYWSNNHTLGNKAIKNAITRDRFLLLASKLYFNHPKKPEGADKLYYMEKLVDCLKYTFKRARSESTFQSIDETMVKFKGRWSGKQYMPSKRPKRGAKIWTRSDAMSGYCYDFNIYKGKEQVATEGTLGERVVIKLCSSIGNEDVVICTDRFFTSYNLMKTLPFACVGTCMSNRKNVPVIKEKLKKGESVAKSTADGIIGFKWQDTKDVLVMSNCHDDTITTVDRKQKDGTKKAVTCPEAISFYNKYMGGVDMTDQYTVLYDIDRKSKKWWKRVFQRLLMTAVTNAWVLYKKLKNKKIPLIDMLVPLAQSLIEIGKAGSKVQRTSGNGRPSKKAKLFVNAQHLPAPSTRRRCTLCATKKLQKRTKFVCTTCEVPLCAGCFLPYHR